MTSPTVPPTSAADAPGPRGLVARPAARAVPLASRQHAPRLLIVRLSAIGDVLHALPAVAALRRARPRARIVWAVEDRAASVLEGHPAIDRLVVLPRKRWTRSLRRVATWPSALREATRGVAQLLGERFDATIDLQGNLKSGLVALASGAPARYGFATEEAREGNGFFLNRRVGVRPRRGHRVERNLALMASCLGEALPYADPGLPRSAAGAAEVEARLAREGWPERGFVVLHPGTSGFGAFKRWPPSSFARLADRLRGEDGVPVVLTFGPGEEPLVEAVRAACAEPPLALPTSSLAVLSELLRRASCVVAGDTGPLHLAAAVGTPVVGLFGPKDEATYGPYGRSPDGSVRPLPVLVRADLPCRPCTLRWCPEPVCMHALEVETVLEAVRRGRGRPRAPAHGAASPTGG